MNLLKLNLIACTLFAAVAAAAPEGARPVGPGPKGSAPHAAARQPAKGAPQVSARQPGAKPAQAATTSAPAKKGSGLHRSTRKTGVNSPRRGRRSDFQDEHLSPEERHLMRTLEHGRDFDELVRIFPVASRSRNPDIRSALVDALEEHEGHALTMLAAMIADPDEEIAESAFSAWVDIVSDMRHLRRARAMIDSAAAIQQRVAPPPMPVVAPAPVVPVVVPQPVLQ